MSNNCIICLGEILFDNLADQLDLPFGEVKSWTAYPGGAPANVACAITKLGTPAAFIGCVGKEQAGSQLVEVLSSIGVDITGVQYHPTAPTRKVYVLRSADGDRSFAGFGDCPPDQFADAFLQSSLLPEKLFLDADFLVLGTLELAYPETRAAIGRALELAEQYDVKVVLDLNWRPMFWQNQEEAEPLIKKLLNSVDFLKLSQEEAELFFATTDAGAIAHRFNWIEGVIVTAGEGDVSYCVSDHEGVISSFSVPVEDTTGAGDSFLAGFIHQLCLRGISSLNQAETVKEIITYACAVGALTTTKPGAIAAQPSALEVETFLRTMGI